LRRNKKQLSSYAGFDVNGKQSGTSIKAKPRISKKGNRSLRKAMYFPSMTAVKHDENFKNIYVRIVSKQGIKPGRRCDEGFDSCSKKIIGTGLYTI
jgi:transposase